MTVGHLERGSTQRGLYLICRSSFKREELQIILFVKSDYFAYFRQNEKIMHFSDVTLDPASKGNVVGMIRQMTTAF